MRVMSAGAGYRYLLASVAVGDGDRSLSDPLVGYYTADGTPPGRWLGTGVASLGDGWIAPGDVVTEDQLRRLLGEGRDPITGQPLGRGFPVYKPESGRRAVAGFDYTFSVPKSVSVLWALATPEVRAAVVAAHHGAIGDVIGLVEREVAATRAGATGPDGPVAQAPVHGIIATGFDHWDSRAGDPQLHTHVVIANKARAVFDGRWRSLDGRPLHAAVVALSEHYNALLADRLTHTLGVTWAPRDRGADRNAGWEITGIPEELLELFSSRSADIAAVKDDLIGQYRAEHGHGPSAETIIRLRQQATIATRPDKTVRSLTELTDEWQRQAQNVLDQDPAGLLGQVVGRDIDNLTVLSEEQVSRIALRVVGVVGERRSTWRYWNLHAEASRHTISIRIPNPTAREEAIHQIVAAAEGLSVRLTPPELTPVGPELQRPDGTSVFRPAHSAVFTAQTLLDAEARLLATAQETGGPTVPVRHLAQAATADPDRPLSHDQSAALIAIGTSGRRLDLLVGPAGAGKTTTMRAMRAAWESTYGTGSVIGLAPSAAAAAVLAEDLGVGTENTAKWLHTHQTGRTGLHPGQLVILDEASLAGTHALDRIVAHARQQGAKVLLLGDWAQLGSVQAGGAFSLLVHEREDVPELTGIHRFTNDWEKQASLQLRDGNPAAIRTYQQHDRIRHTPDPDQAVATLVDAWQADLDQGRSSLMIAATHDTVTQLNSHAQTLRIATGLVDTSTAVRLADGTLAMVGDAIITRRNNRRLTTSTGQWVRNGDHWQLTAIHPDGTITCTSPRGNTLTLPAEYATAHVQLGYAVTVHRAQGATHDTAHLLATPSMTRESLYVGTTRGRDTNTIHLTNPTDPDHEQHHYPTTPPASNDQLSGILSNSGAQQTAHHQAQAEQHRWTHHAQLQAELSTRRAASRSVGRVC
ncbi:MobF family relaxase [Euzebya tangerina]|uniref:MobF family relaxase n=1 Tax=Euzebya tangerina TaxID=591198 RepID=UPI00196B9F4B|nr:MobF family relaxase [Euzebya tangerina]